ncbi:hypothetical protein BCT35_12515 [Vibrio lentus]|uniref:hypothetical protein n=1 Tax=Vibrio lentus TaxID=136468 RepID=UPI000C828680|nr:hypothetical protein [Vibrio lentus]PML44539.1 hypothetical protein BCT75_05710 [Vibrio lentus]PMN32361.1 hypothetical protein BCT35_12515 [Vibrio lentus]
MNPIRSIVTVLLIIPVVLVSYYFVVDFYLTDRHSDKYSVALKYYLSELDTNQNRIFIVAGSNATYGFDAEAISKKLNVPTVNLGDNGGFPLSHKINVLKKLAKPGDTILFPLEWNHYTYGDSIPSSYLDVMFNYPIGFGYYYKHMPFSKKVEFVFKDMPFNYFFSSLRGIFKRDFYNDSKYLTSYEALINTLSIDDRVSYGGIISNDRIPNGDRETSLYQCDEYLFGTTDLSDVNPSSRFINNLSEISSLKKQGINVYLLWPNVTSKNDVSCYSELIDNSFAEYVERIKLVASEFDIDYLIDDPYSSRYDESCFVNTSYHIKSTCADKRTLDVINALKNNGIFEPTGTNNFLKLATSELSKTILKLGNTNYLPTFELSKKYTANELKESLRAGWYDNEKWGAWSQGYASTIQFKIRKPTDVALSFSGSYIVKEPTTVIVNGTVLGDFDLNSDVIYIPKSLVNDRIVSIELKFGNIYVPSEISDSSDNRELNFALTGIILNEV